MPTTCIKLQSLPQTNPRRTWQHHQDKIRVRRFNTKYNSDYNYKNNYSKLLVTNIILISNQVHRTQQWLLQRLQHTRISSRLITTTSNNFMPQMGWLIIIIQPPFLSFCRSLMMSTMMFQLLLQKQLSKVLMLSLSR